MPTNFQNDGEKAEIKVKAAFSGKILVTYIRPEILVNGLQDEMRAICQFGPEQEFTMKWIDEEGTHLYFNDSIIPYLPIV